MAVVTRFAPSPTGPLHLGHAYAALVAHDLGQDFLLRIEDIDGPRCRADYESAIYDDLHWLGLRWKTPVIRQSQRLDFYKEAVAHLYNLGLAYHCTCTRADISAALSAPQEGARAVGPDGPVYPGTCRRKGRTEGAIRLNMARAMDVLGEAAFHDTGTRPGRHVFDAETLIRTTGDVVLARRDIGTSYHIAVVIDDAAQGVNLVSRGEDMFDATAVHVVLQRLLDLPSPTYHHHRLIRDGSGRRLAKRDDARALSKYRAEGASPQDIRRMVGL